MPCSSIHYIIFIGVHTQIAQNVDRAKAVFEQAFAQELLVSGAFVENILIPEWICDHKFHQPLLVLQIF
jgi:hypothetical protein